MDARIPGMVRGEERAWMGRSIISGDAADAWVRRASQACPRTVRNVAPFAPFGFALAPRRRRRPEVSAGTEDKAPPGRGVDSSPVLSSLSKPEDREK